jgi:triphosphoribosyl-dephospho-CoA synthase
MMDETARFGPSQSTGPHFTPGRLAQIACLMEVTARKPGNVHRFANLPGLHFMEFVLSATAILEPLDRAATTGVGRAVLEAIEATRRVVSTNTNLGIVLLLAPLAAVADGADLAEGVEAVIAVTTVADARDVFRAIRLAQPGGLGDVPDQDVAREPTMPLKAVMGLAAKRDSIARQYANGFQQIFGEALPALRLSLDAGFTLETAIIFSYLEVLARHPDSLIARKYGPACAHKVSRRAAKLLDAGWPVERKAHRLLETFDSWLRHPVNRFNPGTTADLVTAALYAALRDGIVKLAGMSASWEMPSAERP